MAAIFTEIQSTLALNQVIGTEFVVSVPSYFSVQERQQVIQAAQIAGVKIDRLLNESSANVIDYGIFRKADLHMETPRLVAFVDIGYSKSSFYVAAVKKNGADILYEKCEKNLGIRNLDQNMINKYVADFQAKHKEDLRENPKSIFRLRQGVERQRTVLSSNKDASINIECIFEDFDYSNSLTREEFEALNKEVLEQFVLFF